MSGAQTPVLQVPSLAYAVVGDVREIPAASLPYALEIYPGQRVSLSDGAGRHARGVVLAQQGGSWSARIIADHEPAE